jgi:HK97 family phage prohead protease
VDREERERIERRIAERDVIPDTATQLEIRAEALRLQREVEHLEGRARYESLDQERELLRLVLEAREGRPVEFPRGDIEWRASAATADATLSVLGSTSTEEVPPIRQVFGTFAPFGAEADISDNLGRYTEVIRPGALRDSLATRGHEADLRLSHGRHPVVGDLPIGVFTALYEDRHGGWFTARPLEAAYVRELVLPAVYNALMFTSFGFWPDESPDSEVWSRRDGRPYRELRRINVAEVTLTTSPAYREGTNVGWRLYDDPVEQSPQRAKQIDSELRHRRQVVREIRDYARARERRRVVAEIRAEQRVRTIRELRRSIR